MRMQDPIMQLRPVTTLKRVRPAQNFQYHNLNYLTSFWRMNERGKETRGAKILLRGRLVRSLAVIGVGGPHLQAPFSLAQRPTRTAFEDPPLPKAKPAVTVPVIAVAGAAG